MSLFQRRFGVLTLRRFLETASFETKPCNLFLLEKGPPTSATVTKEDALLYYKNMKTIRMVENESGKLYKEKIVWGFCHLYSGQEAVAVGIKAAMRKDDIVIGSYRIHGWALTLGRSELEVLAELSGRKSGCSRGKGGSMHMYTSMFYGGQGIVGAQVPLGTGLALASQYNKSGAVTFVCYGDGASNQGQVFESYNMAKLWSLPVVYVIENNGYGMGTSTERSSANTEFHTRAGYIPGISVDGMDVLAVREATKFAIEYVTSGKGPLLAEMRTYRYSGHSMSDPGTSYRTRDEVQKVRDTLDPLTSFINKITTATLVTKEELKEIDSKVQAVVHQASEKARTDKETDMSDLTTDVYMQYPENIRGVLPWEKHIHKRIGRIGKV